MAEQSGDGFAEIEKDGLRTEPAAPDSSEDNRNENNEQQEKKCCCKDKIKFTYPDSWAKKIEFEFFNIKAKRAFTVYGEEWKACKDDGLQDLNNGSVFFPQNKRCNNG